MLKTKHDWVPKAPNQNLYNYWFLVNYAYCVTSTRFFKGETTKAKSTEGRLLVEITDFLHKDFMLYINSMTEFSCLFSSIIISRVVVFLPNYIQNYSTKENVN